MTEFKKIRVKFYFQPPLTEEHHARLQKARHLLTQEGGNFDEEQMNLNDGGLCIALIALIPEEQLNKHHGFESILNKPYKFGGCGAGMVEEVWEPH